MTAASVNIKEIDLSTRVPEGGGVSGAMVLPSLKGEVGVPSLVTNEKQFLDRYTPDGVVKVGMSTGFYSALAFLQKSNSLYVVRPENSGLLYGGAGFKTAASATSNFTSPVGIVDPTAYTFDGLPDVEAAKEVTRIKTLDATGVDGTYVLLHDSAGSVAFWFDVDDSGTLEPAHGADRSVEVTTVATGDSAATVAAKLAAVIAGDAAYDSATIENIDEIVATDAVAEDRTDATAGTSGFTVTVDTQGVTEVNQVDEALFLHGSSQGAWNDKIYVKLSDNTDKEADSFLLEVFKSDNLVTPVESFVCSRILGKKDGYGVNIFVEDVLQGSEYIRGISNPAIDENLLPKDQATPLPLGGGDDGSAVTDGNMITALDSLSNKDEVAMTLVMDAGQSTAAYGTALLSLCENRGDCVALLSTPFAAEASASYISDLVDYRSTTLNANSSYGAMFTPHVKIYDKFNDRDLFVSPDGYAGAAIAFSASNFEIWYPPAGFKRGIILATGLRRNFTKGEMDALDEAQINPIRFAVGKGIAIWGQQTLLSRPSRLQDLHVRLLLNYIKPLIEEALEPFLFDLNDVGTRSIIEALLTDFADGIKARRGLQDFLVIADSTNNTSADIDAGKLKVDFFIKPAGYVKEIPLNLVVTSSGTDFSLAAESI